MKPNHTCAICDRGLWIGGYVEEPLCRDCQRIVKAVEIMPSLFDESWTEVIRADRLAGVRVA